MKKAMEEVKIPAPFADNDEEEDTSNSIQDHGDDFPNFPENQLALPQETEEIHLVDIIPAETENVPMTVPNNGKLYIIHLNLMFI